MKIQVIASIVMLFSLLILIVTATTIPINEESPVNIRYIEDATQEPLDIIPPRIVISTDIDIHSGTATLILIAEDDSGIKYGILHAGSESIICTEYPCKMNIDVLGKNMTYYGLAIDNSENRNSARYPAEGILNIGLIELTIQEEVLDEEVTEINNGPLVWAEKTVEGSSFNQASVVTEEIFENIIENGKFDSKESWIFYTNGIGDFEISPDPITNDTTAQITITTKGSNKQLYQKNLTIESNTTYNLSFDAASPNFGSMDISLIKHTSPYTNYGLKIYQVNLSDKWNSYSIIFTSSVESTVFDARLMFRLAPYAAPGYEYKIDNVILKKYCLECDALPDNDTPPEDNTTNPDNNTILEENNTNNNAEIPSESTNDNLPALTNGRNWILTFNDEFNGKSLDTSKWRGGYSNLQWCPPNSDARGTCPNQYNGLTVSDGVLKLQPNVTKNYSTAYENRAMMHTGGHDVNDARFSQKYGYFEVRAKFPTNKNGEGDGLWISFWALPLGKTNNVHNLGIGRQQEEIDIMESVLGYNMGYTYLNMHDQTLNEHNLRYPKLSVGDLSDKFHTYGLYWKDDGSKYGSIQTYFDGIPQGKAIVLNSRSNYWDNGIYLILQIIPCPLNNKPFGGGNSCTSSTSNNNPFVVDYVKAYKEIP